MRTAASAKGVRLGVALAKGRGSLCCCLGQLLTTLYRLRGLSGSWDFDGGFTYSSWAKKPAISRLALME